MKTLELSPPAIVRELLCVIGAFGAVASAGAAAHPRNVLVMISDNHTRTDLGCYGHPVVRTPHLDAFAREGTRFANAFATVASCGPSRGVIYTGLLTHRNGQYTHGHAYHNGVLARSVTTIADLAKRGGYRTALLGKTSFDPRAGQYEFDLIDPSLSRDLPGQTTVAEKFIREGGDKPFLIVMCPHHPHPTNRPEEVRRRSGHQPPRAIDPGSLPIPSHLPQTAGMRELLAEYYELIETLDAGFGGALEMLKRTGQADNTLVMFFSDQGAPFPNGGYSQYEPGVAVPLIVRHPEAMRRGVVSDAMVSLADITPTILDWTGVAGPPYSLHGRSLLPILEQEKSTGWDSVVLSHVMHEVTMYYPMRTWRDRRYKLIWNLCSESPWRDASEVTRQAPWAETWSRGEKFIGGRSMDKYLWRDPIELYDLQSDPEELVNLADDPKHSERRRAMSEKLLARLRETEDNWLERYQLPMPGEKVKLGVMSPEGYAPPRVERPARKAGAASKL
jgi:N-sulfoglucosamine sulfohydrolase